MAPDEVKASLRGRTWRSEFVPPHITRSFACPAARRRDRLEVDRWRGSRRRRLVLCDPDGHLERRRLFSPRAPVMLPVLCTSESAVAGRRRFLLLGQTAQ